MLFLWPPVPVETVKAGSMAQVQDLLGVPYVVDGALDRDGRWTWFSRPGEVQLRPGLNCSGFVVAAARRLLGWSGTLAEAGQDRLGDSGPGAPLGRDWDFGFDLVLNLTEGRSRRVLLPGGVAEVAGDGRTLRGFDLHDRSAWEAILPLLRPERPVLASLSRVRAGRIEHHHVALLLAEEGHVWFCHTLPGGRSHRLDLRSATGFSRLQRMFGPRHILLVEAYDAKGTVPRTSM